MALFRRSRPTTDDPGAPAPAALDLDALNAIDSSVWSVPAADPETASPFTGEGSGRTAAGEAVLLGDIQHARAAHAATSQRRGADHTSSARQREVAAREGVGGAGQGPAALVDEPRLEPASGAVTHVWTLSEMPDPDAWDLPEGLPPRPGAYS